MVFPPWAKQQDIEQNFLSLGCGPGCLPNMSWPWSRSAVLFSPGAGFYFCLLLRWFFFCCCFFFLVSCFFVVFFSSMGLGRHPFHGCQPKGRLWSCQERGRLRLANSQMNGAPFPSLPPQCPSTHTVLRSPEQLLPLPQLCPHIMGLLSATPHLFCLH